MKHRVLVLAPFALSACLAQRGFPCDESGQCSLEDEGVCQASGWCSYTDEDCASGHRYEAYAPEPLGGACVEVEIDAALSCEAYCAAYPMSCSADLTPYASEDHCLQHCAQWPVGAAEDRATDSLGCRTYHVELATMWNSVVNCTRAGPSGGDVCRSVDPSICADYCTSFQALCNGRPMVASYAEGECPPVCQSWYPGRAMPVPSDSATCRASRLATLAAALEAGTPVPDADWTTACSVASRTGGAEIADNGDDLCVLPALPP